MARISGSGGREKVKETQFKINTVEMPWRTVLTAQPVDTVTYIFLTWMILRYPCRSVSVMVRITKLNDGGGEKVAKVMLGRYTEKNINFARAIKACVQRTGAKIDKLVAAADISRCTYYKHLRKPDLITVGELRTYIKMLGIPKEDVIAALYFD